MGKEFTSVNHSIPKIDAIGLVTGRPAYTDDLAPRDALVVKLLRSPHAFAKIAAIDTEKASAVPGVACILTWKDVERIPYTRAGQGHPEPSPHDKFILDEYVRYVGDEVAIVAAEDEASAAKALSLIDVKYEILEPVLDFESAADNSVIIHPEPEIHEMFPIGFKPKRNIAASYDMKIGDVEKELAAGKPMPQIALDHGVAQADLTAFMTDIHKTAFAAAVKDGVITQAQADFMLQRMSQRGYGAGNGYGPGNCPMYGGNYNQGRGAGFGPGMMGGRWQSQNQ